ncbi:MAG: acetate/propionate family kinase [Pseudonocardia sp.]|nr:acetate/propionate family kinase [Pseudonocardia sp.]
MRVLTVNTGSSSVKIRVLDDCGDEWSLTTAHDIAADRGRPDPEELNRTVAAVGEVDAAAHRIVHGGARFTGPVAVDPVVRGALHDLVSIAPLHQPRALDALDLTAGLLPQVPVVACFDTAFHARMPAAASTYAVPASWRTAFGVRRYGFHGLAHEWAARRAVTRVPGATRIVVAHLGSGASLCAVTVAADGTPHSVDTTMGLTPTAGLVMGTRTGDLDPAVPLWLVRQHGLDVADVAAALDRESGLRGLTGTDDMRTVLEREAAGDRDAMLAVQVWLHRLRAGIAAMAAALGGLDVLAFSGGIGEHEPDLLRRVTEGLGFLGVRPPQQRQGTTGGRVRTIVVHTREEVIMAEQARAVLGDLTSRQLRDLRPACWRPVSPVHYGAGGRRSEV